MTMRQISLVITKRTLLAVMVTCLVMVAVLGGPQLWDRTARRLHGVRPGVTLAGHDMGGLLKEELYDAVAGLAEGHAVEARNARYDWDLQTVTAEQAGRVVDVRATVEQILQARSGDVAFVTVAVLPSITQAHFSPYYQGPTTDPKVGLMINVDWGDEHIPAMLEILERFGVLATWFPTGRWVSRSPDLARSIADAGHEVGNHGGWHGMASKMSMEEVRRLILDGEEKIEEAIGERPRVFAPPAGDMNKQTVAIAGELGYKTVLWTIDTVDWQRPAPTVIVDRVIGRIRNGVLILMHPTQPTVEALPVIIDRLQSQGYSLVTVSELLAD